MRRSTIVFVFAVILLSAGAGAQSVPATLIPSDAEIHRILAARVDSRQSVGIVVGVIEPAGKRVVAYGVFAKDDKRPLNGCCSARVR